VVPIVTRETTRDVHLGGEAKPYLVPKGTRMMILIQGVHHRGDIWAEPQAYQPDRFLEMPKPFTFLPFIDGPRNCLGQHLALLEAKIVLATLCQRFSFEAVGGEQAGKKHPSMVPVIPADPGLMVRVA
jgi:cytochrome P450